MDQNFEQMLADIMYLCTQTNGTRGIWKQIDEVRELYECIQKFAPEFLQSCHWVEGWLVYQYSFLVSLRMLLNLPAHPLGLPGLPRPLVGCRIDWDGLSAHFVDCSRKKSGSWLEEHARGKDDW
ncbi:MAG: hypothetical protein LBR94_05885 [Desulfovibrio sp.]|nr:hypothetical protein [Desulfovibrio sp.]